MNSAMISNPSKPIPKEIQFIDRHQNYFVALNKLDDDTERIEPSLRRKQRGSRWKHRKEHLATHACRSLPLPIMSMRNRRRESLTSISRHACSDAQKFVEAEHNEILPHYSSTTAATGDGCNVLSPPSQDEHEQSLSALAGLLSASLAEAAAKGHITFEAPMTSHDIGQK